MNNVLIDYSSADHDLIHPVSLHETTLMETDITQMGAMPVLLTGSPRAL